MKKPDYLKIQDKKASSILARIRSWMHNLRNEEARWEKKGERNASDTMCKMRFRGREDEDHVMRYCGAYKKERD